MFESILAGNDRRRIEKKRVYDRLFTIMSSLYGVLRKFLRINDYFIYHFFSFNVFEFNNQYNHDNRSYRSDNTISNNFKRCTQREKYSIHYGKILYSKCSTAFVDHYTFVRTKYSIRIQLISLFLFNWNDIQTILFYQRVASPRSR